MIGKMKEFKAGLRFSEENGISFFGLDEINNELMRGGKVISIKEGGVIMRKKASDEDNIGLTISGFSVILEIEE
jgi:hypothetical protein